MPPGESLVERDAGGASVRARIWGWLLDRLKVPAISTLLAASVFAADVVGVWFAAVSVTRLFALVGAPFVSRRKFAPDREWLRILMVQLGAVGLADVARRLTSVIDDATGQPSHAASAAIFLAVGVVWLMAHVTSVQYANDRGGLLAAYRLRDAAERALNVMRVPADTASDLDAVARSALRVCAITVICGIFANIGIAEIKSVTTGKQRQGPGDSSQDVGHGLGRNNVQHNPDADEYCKYNVYDKIAAGVPENIANALASVYGGTHQQPAADAPGAEIVGCPVRGTVREGALYVTRLYHPRSAAEMGMLVSDDRAAAAVVYPTLRRTAAGLIDARIVVRVEHRARTMLGDAQLFHLLGGACSLMIREYNKPYVQLPPVITALVVTHSVTRQEIPRISTRRAHTARIEYVLEFADQPTPVVVTYDPVLQVAITGAGAAQATSDERTCPAVAPFYELAKSSVPARPDHTP